MFFIIPFFLCVLVYLYFAFIRLKTKLEDVEYAHLPNVDTDEEQDGNSTNHKFAARRRGLRSDCSLDSNTTNGVSHTEGNNNNIKSSSRYGFFRNQN